MHDQFVVELGEHMQGRCR